MKKNKERGGQILLLIHCFFLGLISLFGATALTIFPKYCVPSDSDHGVNILLGVVFWGLFIMCVDVAKTAIHRIRGGLR